MSHVDRVCQMLNFILCLHGGSRALCYAVRACQGLDQMSMSSGLGGPGCQGLTQCMSKYCGSRVWRADEVLAAGSNHCGAGPKVQIGGGRPGSGRTMKGCCEGSRSAWSRDWGGYQALRVHTSITAGSAVPRGRGGRDGQSLGRTGHCTS